jgi:hypothetical protein
MPGGVATPSHYGGDGVMALAAQHRQVIGYFAAKVLVGAVMDF